MIELWIVVPCFNEMKALPGTHARIREILTGLIAAELVSRNSKICYVDDGSSDNTWTIIEQLAENDNTVVGIKLAANVGHQNALLAGLMTVPGDAVVTIDADLQDEPDAIARMVGAHREGAEIVYGVRSDRSSDTLFKRMTARAFYRLMRALGATIVQDHADYRLLGRRAIEVLREFREVNLFLRGLVPLLGFRSDTVYYVRQPRHAGISKYPLRKMIGFALNAITSFSAFPMRLITYIGIVVFVIAGLLSLWTLYVVLIAGDAVPGWASTVLPIYFIGGIQILCIGILGEYAGKIYLEVKARPRYWIESMKNLSSPR